MDADHPAPSPFALLGVRVLTRGPAGDPGTCDHRGVVALDLGGRGEAAVIGVRLQTGVLVFRRLAECRVLPG